MCRPRAARHLLTGDDQVNRRGVLNGFTAPLIVGFVVSAAAVTEGVTNDTPWLLVVPSAVIGGILLLMLRKLVDLEKAVAAVMPVVQQHTKDIDGLKGEAATVDKRIGDSRHLLRGEFQVLHSELEQDYREHLDDLHPRRGP